MLRRHQSWEKATHCYQLIVSTHSSHVVHRAPLRACDISGGLPVSMVAKVPVSTVVNLSQVFGEGTETERFVTRHLRAQHADLFFADAAILVEGPAERMLIPNFIGLTTKCCIRAMSPYWRLAVAPPSSSTPVD